MIEPQERETINQKQETIPQTTQLQTPLATVSRTFGMLKGANFKLNLEKTVFSSNGCTVRTRNHKRETVP